MGLKVVPYAYGNPLWVYAYGPSHALMEQYTHTLGRTYTLYVFKV